MKFFNFAILSLLVIALLVDDITAQKVRKHKKFRKHHKPTSAETVSREVEDPKAPIDDEAAAHAASLARENELAREAVVGGDEVIDNRVPLIDPCFDVHCGAGRVCEVNKEGDPHCVCISSCPEEVDVRRKVCSNQNETWPSDCSVYQQKCFCDKGDARCKGERYHHVHIEYYGECREMPMCTTDEMADFPRRMRDWLFNIMRDMADRQELTPHYLKLEREAETNMTVRWANAAVWKFCDLDGNPPDRSVSRHELFPIKAPLMSLEHCIGPFLNGCDSDGNHRITIKEWAKCLELEEEDINENCDKLLDDDE